MASLALNTMSTMQSHKEHEERHILASSKLSADSGQVIRLSELPAQQTYYS